MPGVRMMPSCTYCGSEMLLAWKGLTPFRHELEAYICPRCYSTLYLGWPEDPVFQILCQINRAFKRVLQPLKSTKEVF